ncbi:helix-turn-helix transcriptional regulator [Metabacillus iocasae]|uniref:DNA-binding XRE family transcriptional regulator n=1 Tax=Priestia iocasae TaxID=2291674 RepID=A0ABS2QWT9_9BACI|nr:helix-turn-helix domain-containing protein [Metabacillus iocasae]MBM7703944.1 DNA-binding XRE family transcriptional regulator [Metabacillus iocasae]
MKKERVIEIVSEKMKLVRTEKGYSQDKMAEVIGLSKKTLVQIEKGRTQASWTSAVAVCALFRDSEVLHSVLGSDPLEIIETIAHDGLDRRKAKTMGGHVWWREVEKSGRFRLQQNYISQHYRIVDEEDYRWFSSFYKGDTTERFRELTKGE